MSPRGRPAARSASASTLTHGVSAAVYRQRPFARSLVLLTYLITQLGGSYSDLLRRLSERANEQGAASLVDVLATRPGRILPDEALARYERNVRMHEARLAQARPDFRLTWFQWLTAFFTEMTLDAIKRDERGLLAALEQMRLQSAAFLSPFKADDIRKLACFMATGSGKTLLLHINLLQFLHYKLFEPDNILLMTPNIALSEQHRQELVASGLDDLGVRILEITRLYVDSASSRRVKKGVSEPTSRFEGPNLILVDEGHKGGSNASEQRGEREWREIREALARGNTDENHGFVFEYSATFAQMAAKSAELYDEYAKCTVMDFGYARFHRDGYGKDFRILNAQTRDGSDVTLAAGLLSFYRQVQAHEDNPALIAEYQLAAPLWVALGKSVTAASGSDVLQLLTFLDKAAADTPWLAKQFERVRRDVNAMQPGLNGDPLDFSALASTSATELAKDAQRLLFGGSGRLHLSLLSANEIGLRGGGAGDDRHCGVVRVGEAHKLLEMIRKDGGMVIDEPDKLSGSLFSRIESDANLRFLIGAKMFVEGWSSWRVSAMALMNVGKSAGSEIVQMFGRGVRLRGKAMSLRRAGDAAPEPVRLLETLYVFGVQANYLETFVATLRDEGVAREVHYLSLRRHDPPVDMLGLLTLQDDDTPFTGIVVPDPQRDAAQITLDNGIALIAGLGPAQPIGVANQVSHALDDSWLDGESLYQQALDWKARNGLARVAITPALVRDLAAQSRVLAPSGLIDGASEGAVERRAELARRLIEMALDGAVYRAQRTHYSSGRRTALLTSENANFPVVDIDGTPTLAVRIEAETRDDILQSLRKELASLRAGGMLDGATVQRIEAELVDSTGVGDASAAVQKVLKIAVTETSDCGLAPLPRLYLDQHLYNPLLVEQPFEERGGQMALFDPVESGVRVSPPPLVESEARFVFDLRAFWSAARDLPEWTDCELYLLRNQARTGYGFFVGVGFYPDFLLWLKRGKRQVLAFVEPKGLGRAWPQAKIELLADLPGHSPKELPLRGFIVTPTPLGDIRALQPNASEASLAAKGILLQSTSAASAGYVATLMQKLLPDIG